MTTAPAECLFCKFASGAMDVPKLYENEHVIAIRDISPRAPVHVLIIPRRHIATAADIQAGDGELLAQMFLASSLVAGQEGMADRGYRLAFNVKGDAGMTIWHLHMHLLGGRPLGVEG